MAISEAFGAGVCVITDPTFAGGSRGDWNGRTGTDNTAAIQAAIQVASAAKGIVLVPPGYFLFSRITNPDAVPIVGLGFSNSVQAAFGNPEWKNPTKFKGSVLVSSASSGDAVSFGIAGTNHQFRIRDLMILGIGSGSATGLHLLRSVGSDLQNVLVANFSRGWHMENVQSSAFFHPQARGCSTSFRWDGSITSNNNAVYAVEAQDYTVVGIDIANSAQVNHFGGLVQDGQGGYGYRTDDNTSQCHMTGTWFESSPGARGAVQLKGFRNTIEKCEFGSSNDHLEIHGDLNVVRKCSVLEANATIAAGATGTMCDDLKVNRGTFTDRGTNTVRREADSYWTMGGVAGGAATSTRLVKSLSGMSDGALTRMVTITVPNSAHSAAVKLILTGSLGPGGAIGANEASTTSCYTITIMRTPNRDAVLGASSAYGVSTARATGAAPCSVSIDVTDQAGASSATQTWHVRVSVRKGGGGSNNHTVVGVFELENANGSGVTID
jgi:hypothetical protein